MSGGTDPTPSLLGLPDGRTLAWRSHGPEGGRVVVHHHGGLVSGSYASTAAATCEVLGIRLLTPDRPGIGASTAAPGRTTASFAADVAALLDHLDVDRAGSLGWSMGGQYAVATAAELGERIDALVVVAGAIPLDDPTALAELNRTDRRLTTTCTAHPWRARRTFGLLGALARRAPARVGASMGRGLNETDKAVIGRVGPALMGSSMAEAMTQPEGMAEEYRAWARPWGVPLAPVGCATTVVRGTEDHLIPEAWAARLAEGLGAERVEREGDGHLFLLERWQDVLAPFTA
jgi:pimeloyl-ACP methyl ester carboxylesterase